MGAPSTLKQDTFVHDLVSRQAKLRPDAAALIFSSHSITYGQLEKASTAVANRLRSQGIRSEALVPVLTTRCIECIVCVLGVLKAGACYVPIDVENWKQARIKTCLQAIKPSIVLTIADADTYGYKRIDCSSVQELLEESIESDEEQQPRCSIDSESLAYMIFTSGTTGNPKGVMIPHRALSNYVQQGDSEAPFNMGVLPSDNVLLIFSIGFDAATGVIFSTLANGGILMISSSASFHSDATKCTILGATPSLLQTISDTAGYDKVRAIFLGGEAPSRSLIARWSTPQRRLWNCYGPTESTCCSTISELLPDKEISLGVPMENSSVILLDGDNEATQGEICLSGPGLAKGYFNDPMQTAEKFVAWKSKLLYRTGDFARTTPLGLLFLGREDRLVKVRGFLVSLDSDVLAALCSYPQVSNAAVFLDHGLLSCCVAPQTIDTQHLRFWLRQRYEHYVVPDKILVSDHLPMNANGKVDIEAVRQLQIIQTAPTIQGEFSQDENFTLLIASISKAFQVPESHLSPYASFIELGGNSMTAMSVASNMLSQGYDLSMAKLFALPSLASVSSSMRRSPREESLDGYASRSEPLQTAPLSQVSGKLLRSLMSKPTSNFLSIIIDIDTAVARSVNGQQFREAWESALTRYDIFRCTFDLEKDQQTISADGFEKILDFAEIDSDSNDKYVKLESCRDELLGSIGKLEFTSLMQPPHFLRFMKRNDRSSVALWLVHHSQIDGWSAPAVLEDVQAILNGDDPLDRVSFLETAVIQKKEAARQESAAKVILSELLDFLPTSNAPEPTRSQLQTYTAPPEKIHPTGVTIDRLEMIALSKGVTSAAIIHAAWAFVLSCYTTQSKVAFGSVFHGRNLHMASSDSVVGPLINTCPLLVDTETGVVSDLLRTVHHNLLALNDTQWGVQKVIADVPERLAVKMFSSILAVEYRLPGVSQPEDYDFRLSSSTYHIVPEFGLLTLIQSSDHELETRIIYDPTMYQPSVVHQMSTLFANTLKGVLNGASSTEILKRSATFHSLLPPLSWSGPQSDPTAPGRYLTLKSGFATAVTMWPDEIAVETTSGDRTIRMSYFDLDIESDAVASSIASADISNAIGIFSDGSLDWLVGILAVIKLGVACVPIDVDLPHSRIKDIIVQANLSLVICPHDCDPPIKLPRGVSSQPISALGNRSVPKRTYHRPSPQDTAYIVFTSGTVGNPKGVPISHRAITSFISHPPARMHAEPKQRIAQTFSVGFDGCTAEVFGTLCYGGTLVLRHPEHKLAHLRTVNATMATPSLLALLSAQDYANLSTIVVAGEAVSQTTVDIWAHGRRLYNGYGPSECGFVSLMAKLEPGKPVTIGSPVPGTAVCILDSSLNHVPIGVSGEICILGPQVAQGYLEQKSPHQSRFTKSPYDSTERMYRTGDLGAWADSGEIVYKGRTDNQVKVRGFRIELEEVDAALLKADGRVTHAATIKVDDQLISYVTPKTLPAIEIKQKVMYLLPYYAQPSSIIPLDTLPLNANLKVDRQSLSSRRLPNGLPRELARPSGRLGTLIQSIWNDTLPGDQKTSISANDEFLELGGNSISQLKMVRELSRRLGIAVPNSMAFRNPSLYQLTNAIEVLLNNSQANIPPTRTFATSPRLPPQTRMSTSYLENEMYALHVNSSIPAAFNISFSIDLEHPQPVEVIRSGVEALVGGYNNKILRSRYEVQDGILYRRSATRADPLSVIDFISLHSNYLDAIIARPFDLSEDQPIRFAAMAKHGFVSTLHIVVHHIIADKDAVFRIMSLAHEEIKRQSLLACNDGTTSEELHTSMSDSSGLTYADWAIWSNEKHSHDHGDTKFDFWRSLFDSPPQQPYSSDIPYYPSLGRSLTFAVRLDHMASRTLSHALASTLFCLCTILESDDITIGIPYSLRDEKGTENLIGLLLDRLPLRLKLVDHSHDLRQVLEHVRNTTQKVLDNALPYHVLKEEFASAIDFDIMVTFHYLSDNKRLGELASSAARLRPHGALFPLEAAFEETLDGVTCTLTADLQFVPLEHLERLENLLPNMLADFSCLK